MKGQVVVVIERAEGNEKVGTSWLETNIFETYDTLEDVLKWTKEKKFGVGKVIITVAE